MELRWASCCAQHVKQNTTTGAICRFLLLIASLPSAAEFRGGTMGLVVQLPTRALENLERAAQLRISGQQGLNVRETLDFRLETLSHAVGVVVGASHCRDDRA